jgi:hypothetical protein
MDPVLDPLLLRKSDSAGNRTWDLCVSSQKLTTRPQTRSSAHAQTDVMWIFSVQAVDVFSQNFRLYESMYICSDYVS